MFKVYPILVCCICLFISETLLYTNYSFEYVKVFNETSRVLFHGRFVLKRNGRDYPKIFADFEITESVKNFDVEMKIFYSPLGNRQYILLPSKIYRQPCCKVLNSEFRSKFMYDLQKYSNLPFSEDHNVDLCDLMPMGHYYLRNYTVAESTIHRSTPPGRYRVQFLYYRKGERYSCRMVEVMQLFT